MTIISFFKENLDINDRKILKLDQDIKTCSRQLTAIKLKLCHIEMQLLAMKTMYHDIMELRKLLLILHPYLKPRLF